MRIIDKNHDFYDYLQNPTDNTLVFDRRGSFTLSKARVCEAIPMLGRRTDDVRFRHLLVQCGAHFWVFLLTVTKYNETLAFNNVPCDYELELLASWKNYDKPSKVIDVSLIEFANEHLTWHWRDRTWSLERDNIKPDKIKTTIDRIQKFDDYNSVSLNKFKCSISTKNGYETKEYSIPLLNACGVASHISPLDVFCAIEEHFSREKTSSERTEPLGITNDDKIIMHGFDTKTSFRGKN